MFSSYHRTVACHQKFKRPKLQNYVLGEEYFFFISYDSDIKRPVQIKNALMFNEKFGTVELKETAMYYVVKLFGGEFELNSKN